VKRFFLLVFLILNSCTSINVKPVAAGVVITNVCVEINPKVIVADFLPVVRSGFDRHGIHTKIVSRPAPQECEYVLSYTAFKTWDLTLYLHHAELKLESKGKIIASAEYHLKGQGGLALTKFKSTKEKMTPVIDKLLINVNK